MSRLGRAAAFKPHTSPAVRPVIRPSRVRAYVLASIIVLCGTLASVLVNTLGG